MCRAWRSKASGSASSMAPTSFAVVVAWWSNGVDIDHTAGQCAGAPRGALYIDGTGYPQLDASNNYVVGDPNPDWTGSLRTAFRYKHISLSGLLDIRHGGENYNGTRGAMDHFGTSAESQFYRDAGDFVFGQSYLKGPVAGPGAGMGVPLGESWFTGPGGVLTDLSPCSSRTPGS